MTNPTAAWSIQLHADCPQCRECVDLLEAPDFFDGTSFDLCEHGTERTNGVTVVCPECGHEFAVDFEY